MFERYTEKARRTIFFARYEASQFGSPYIETEHLLLGLLREDKTLVHHFLGSSEAVDSIRKQIEGHTVRGEKVSTSVDLPLSHDCKIVLAYGAEEAQRLNHMVIEAEHLLLGLLREEKCFAAQLLGEQGITLESVREQVQQSGRPLAQGGSACFARLERWLAEREARGGIQTVRVMNRTGGFVIYAVDPPKDTEKGGAIVPAEKLAQIQWRIDCITNGMERAIANHEFEKARFYSDEERKERENLRLLREQYNLEEPPPRVPALCIEIIGDERFAEVQKRCDGCIAKGVTEVWVLEPNSKRAYAVTKAEGLREFRGGVLQIANPPLEMDLKTIFG
jgi:hypothetical protein